MRRVRTILLRLFAGVAVFASIFTAWVFWPRPIEGFWDDPGPQCLCNGCHFLYFHGGRVYQFHGNHGATYLGEYSLISPGVYRFTWDQEGCVPHTIYVYGPMSRWTEGGTAPSIVWRLLSTAKPKQLLDIIPIKTLDGKSVTLNATSIEQPHGQSSPDRPP